MAPSLLVMWTIANAILVMSAYLAVAALVWGFVEAAGDQPLDLEAFGTPADGARIWRIAHLSDVHVVGERYGFRIESGRAGPRGNSRLVRAMERLAALHASAPLDLVLVTGDMTDAGLSAEWAEFLDIVAAYPALAERMLILPGNHDLNIVDRANPARLDLPMSPAKTLRKMRALSAIATIAGGRVRVSGVDGLAPGPALADALEPWRDRMADFADAGGMRRSARLAKLWNGSFPLILPPATDDGLGVALLDSNADANFSFTNALGMISSAQAQRLKASLDAHPKACWIVALHHHLAEYPRPVEAFSERIGTALINGAWFLRILRPYAGRVVVMHGHRHIDWIGRCGPLRLVSAPSPVMARPDQPTHFHVHSLAAGSDGSIRLMTPQRVDLDAAFGRTPTAH
jgi:3',5'-cyclic AMP phosphodiesterase CpdA